MNTLSLLDYEHKTEDKDLLEIFNQYPYELDHFQKHGIEKTFKNENILITVNTGSGKTILADYAIRKSIADGKKCIYTSPIKSLSNQKFYEFKKKFKGVATIGIMTGDIKYRPDADVIIMTTEILRNLLYKKDYQKNNIEYKLDLNIDLSTDVSCVVFDEVHYIGDKDRGKVWEESLILLPRHINLVLLSATINNADDIAMWIQQIKQKPCHLIPKKERIVPLTHYLYYYSTYPKKCQDKSAINFIIKNSNKMIEVVNSKNVFNETNYQKVRKVMTDNYKIGNSNNSKVGVMNSMISYLKKKEMCPVLFFVFSRKQCEVLAHSVNQTLNTVQEQQTVEKIVRNHIHMLYNKDLYLKSNEYYEILKLLTNGIAYHHSGLQTVYKEIIELLCNQGLVKVLFATETFSVGINAPIKTVVFTDIQKYSNEGMRYLKSNEYKQMAGRAGRRGIDTVGNVILLANFMELPTSQEMKNITCGTNEHIVSRFNLSYQFILKVILSDEITFENFMNHTLYNKNKNSNKDQLLKQINEQLQFLGTLPLRLPLEDLDKYYFATEKKNNKVKLTKGEKNLIKKMEAVEDFENIYQEYLVFYENQDYYKRLVYEFENQQDDMTFQLNKMIKVLIGKGYLNLEEGKEYSTLDKSNITQKGIICSQINDCSEILLTEMIESKMFDDLNHVGIAAILGIFSNSRCLSDEMKVYDLNALNVPQVIKVKLTDIEKMKDSIEKQELEQQYATFSEMEINYEMVEYTMNWVAGKNFNELNFDNYIGEFIKDMLKLDNIVNTMETIAQVKNDYTLLSKLQMIHPLIIRDVVSNESLYIKI